MSVMLNNRSVEYLTTRATMKCYYVAYSPSFKNSLFSVAKVCDNDNNVFLFNKSKSYGISVNDSNRALLDEFMLASFDLNAMKINEIRDFRSSIYTENSFQFLLHVLLVI